MFNTLFRMESSIEKTYISRSVIDTKIYKTVLFNDQAEVHRSLDASLKPGINEIHIKNLCHSFISDSFRIQGRGNVQIHDILILSEPSLTSETDSQQLAALRENYNQSKNELKTLKDKRYVVDKKMNAIEGLLKKVNINDDYNLSGIDSVLDFYEKSALKIQTETNQLDELIDKCAETLKKDENLLRQYDISQDDKRLNRSAIITVSAKDFCDVTFLIAYHVRNASWQPKFDIRVTSKDSKMVIKYYGKIQQSTGEDWKNTRLFLSTGKPSVGGEVPQLGTLDVFFDKENARTFSIAKTMSVRSNASKASSENADQKIYDSEVKNIMVNELTKEYEISRLANIDNGTKEYLAKVYEVDLNIQLIHECVPSKSPYVFLRAFANNSSTMHFLAGSANIFVDNCFVTKTFINNLLPGMFFSCTLGIDESIRVRTDPLKSFHRDGSYFDYYCNDTTEQCITVQNATARNDILLTLKHHVPRMTDSSMSCTLKCERTEGNQIVTEVEKLFKEMDWKKTTLQPIEGLTINPLNNLEWTVRLRAMEEKRLKITQSIRYPMNEKLVYREKF